MKVEESGWVLPVAVLAVFVLSLVGALPALGETRDDEAALERLAELIPGTPVAEAELARTYGRGVGPTVSGSLDDSSALRSALKDIFASLGIKGPLVPAAGTDTSPRISIPAAPSGSFGGLSGMSRSAGADVKVPTVDVDLPRIRVPSVSLP